MFLGVIMCNSYVTNVLSYCTNNTFVLGISFFFFVFTSLHSLNCNLYIELSLEQCNLHLSLFNRWYKFDWTNELLLTEYEFEHGMVQFASHIFESLCFRHDSCHYLLSLSLKKSKRGTDVERVSIKRGIGTGTSIPPKDHMFQREDILELELLINTEWMSPLLFEADQASGQPVQTARGYYNFAVEGKIGVFKDITEPLHLLKRKNY